MITHDELARLAQRVVLEVMTEGDLKGNTGWEAWDPGAHAIRARDHIKAWFHNDESEDHLRHALTRITMEIALEDLAFNK